MWEFHILGVDVYHLLNWFFLYSFFGWLFESTYVSIKSRKLVNRGYVTGPFCTIYGVGALSVYLILRPVQENFFLLYFGGVLVATLIEYITAVIMEKLFHTTWWDYSGKRFQFQGRICLGSSVAWGFFTVLLFVVLQPFVEWLCGLYPPLAGKVGVSVVLVLYGVDFVAATITAAHLSEKLRKFQELTADLSEYIQSTRIYGTAEEFWERFGTYPGKEFFKNMRERLEDRKELLMLRAEELELSDYRAQIEERLSQYQEKFTGLRKKEGFQHHRVLKAYPDLRIKTKSGKKHKKSKRKNKK